VARVAFTDDEMFGFLRVVVTTEHGRTWTAGPEPTRTICEMERAGWLWLRPKSGGYFVQPTPEGASAVRRWSSRQAKEAAVRFGREQ